ncbi:hypothetical protein OIU79_023812 [Salix purpurea]|uniref:Uncharacterized protein n=1 Tax=Salix purpurea TaxID=77065 RepID=A0A9Q0W9G6_SALPP|nr:hypothetical protein OIU79_023812 [Salix purpurea]
MLVVMACIRVRHKVGTGNKGTTYKVGMGNKGTTLKVIARKGLLTISRTRSRAVLVVLVVVACIRMRHKVGTGNKGTTHKVGYGQQEYNSQGERKEGFVDNIKDKIPVVLVVVACIRVRHKVGYRQQGHNTQGGYGQQGYNAQGECKEGFVDNIKGQDPRVVAVVVLVLVACIRVRHKVDTGNKGTMHKVSPRKDLLTRSSTRYRGIAVAV